ncbi:hypothetical protein [Agaribacter flavus]|uniref:Uncharacterized protein n=1 Tax=Agaribacter flavus TaxID=1902781 RepID=A0ABV7FT44_9ALTE
MHRTRAIDDAGFSGIAELLQVLTQAGFADARLTQYHGETALLCVDLDDVDNLLLLG